ncbi:hypothetical protein [Nocardia sp. JMUB6875]
MSEDLGPQQYLPVWSSPSIDNPASPIENSQSPTTHDYAVFRAAAPTDE